MSFFGKIADSLSEGIVALKREPEVAKWLDEIADARKREERYRKDAQRCVDIYESETTVDENGKPAYNILYANTDTLSPALYNSTPRPVVKRRFSDENALADLGAKAIQRVLEFLIDSNDQDYSPFDNLQKAAVVQGLVPGRGFTRFKYHPTLTSVPPTEEALGLDPAAEPAERLDYETICGQQVGWNRVLMGFAETWAAVPWIAFEHFMTRKECIENFGEEVGTNIKLTASPKGTGDKQEKAPADSEGVKFAHIYEIWDKATKEVIFISEGLDTPVKKVEDPLELDGFYNLPEPLIFLSRISSMLPQPLYLMYEAQAQELDDVTKRIKAITKALKVRGFYDSTLTGMDNLMNSGDNTLLPAQNVAALQQGQTLDKSIWLMPIETLVQVLQQLYQNRQQVKQVIYEITGIADIMRGSSAASETLGAQKMKEAWGTLRLKRNQKEAQRYARDSLRLMAEIASKKFGPDTFAKMTGIQLPSPEEKAQAQAFMQQQQAMQAQAEMMAQQGGQPPAPPDEAQMAQAQKVLSTPGWEDVIGFLRNDIQRNFSIDIETNSTIDAEATEDKEQVAEFMNAMSQLLNGLQPMVESGFMPFEAAKQMLIAVTQRFRFGQEVQDQLKAMTAPQPKGDPKADAEAAKMKQEMDLAQQMHQFTLQKAQMDTELQKTENAAKAQKIQMDSQLAMAKFKATMQQLGMEVQAAEVKLDATLKISEAKIAAANAPKPAPAGAK